VTAVKATTVRPMPLLIETVKVLQAKAIKAEGKAHDLWITIGCELKEAKERHKELDGELTWPEFSKKYFNFGQSRADELIRIADGRTTVDVVSEKNKAKHRKIVSGRTADSKREARDETERRKSLDVIVADLTAGGKLSDQQIADYHERGIMPPWELRSACGALLMQHRPDEVKPTKEELKFCGDPMKFLADYHHRIQVWMLSNIPSERIREELINSIQTCADGMSQLAMMLRPDGAPP
jgi:hypothetical protein